MRFKSGPRDHLDGLPRGSCLFTECVIFNATTIFLIRIKTLKIIIKSMFFEHTFHFVQTYCNFMQRINMFTFNLLHIANKAGFKAQQLRSKL